MTVAALLAAYFVCAWIGTAAGRPAFAAIAVLCLASALLWPAVRRARAWAIGAWLGVAAVLAACLAAGVPRLPGYFVPALIMAGIGSLFGITLRAGATPLIERFVRALDGPELAADPAVRRYARRVTQVWAFGLWTLACLAAALAFCVVPDGPLATFGVAPPFALSPGRFSLLANGGGYGLVAFGLALEFALRRVVLPQAPRHAFLDFARRVARAWPQLRRP